MPVARPLIACSLLALSLAAGLAAGPAGSQTQMPPPPQPHARPAAAANICTTQLGWCQLPTVSAPVGVACTCLTAQNQHVPGVTRYFPYEGPASPYLQPHTGPPTTIP